MENENNIEDHIDFEWDFSTSNDRTGKRDEDYLEWYWLGSNPVRPNGDQIGIPYRVRELGLLSPGEYWWVERIEGVEINDLKNEKALFLGMWVVTDGTDFYHPKDDWTVFDSAPINVTSSRILNLPTHRCRPRKKLEKHEIPVRSDCEEVFGTVAVSTPIFLCSGQTFHFLTGPSCWKTGERVYLVEDIAMRHLASIAASYADYDSDMEEVSNPEAFEAHTPTDCFFDIRYQTAVPLEDIESWENERYPLRSRRF